MRQMTQIVDHPNFVEDLDSLLRTLDASEPGRLVALIGPSGIGKSLALKIALSKVAGHCKDWGAGRIPVAYVEATQSDKNYFNSKHLMKDIYQTVLSPNLRWLKEVFDDFDSEALSEQLSLTAPQQLRVRDETEMGYRDAFINAARDRSLRFLAVDDSRAMTIYRNTRSSPDHMLSYMTLANQAGITMVFAGTPAIAELFDIPSEPRRRTAQVLMSRYRADTESSSKNLLALCLRIGERFPIDEKTIGSSFETIVYATAGVFDEILGLFKRAFESMVRRGGKRILKSDIDAGIYTETKLTALWKDIKSFDNLSEPVSMSKLSSIVSSAYNSDSE